MKVVRRVLVIFGVLLGVWLAVRLTLAWTPYPELESFLSRPVSTRLLDRNGGLLQVLPLKQGLRRELVAWNELPRFVPQIFLAAEDRRFYFHPGVDPLAVARALVQNSDGHIVSGASTITMQLARLVNPRPAGWSGKLAEMFDALRLEARFGKDRILELYLNNLTFSFQAEGVASASRAFFGKPVAELTPEEAAVLAVVPRRPSLYSPLDHPEEAVRAAQRLAVGSGLGTGVFASLAPEAFAAAVAQAHTDNGPRRAPHFVRAFFQTKEGLQLLAGRAEVRTSLDPELQQALEGIIELTASPWASSRLTQGAGVVFDNASGAILAYSGSRNFDDQENSGEIDGVAALNQPGSTLKPFLYALALEKGFLPNTVLPDVPTDFGSDQVYVPTNFNGRFNGPVRLRVALASSLNVPAVYTLQRLGVVNFEDSLVRAGFQSLQNQKDTLGVGLALGNARVSLFELARAFAVFPRSGVPLEASPLADAPKTQPREPLMSPTTAALIADILSDNPSRFVGFGHGKVMNTPYQAMFKTGTSNQYQNVWALGATPDFTVGVWMGNFDGQTIIGRTGSGIPARAVVLVLDRIARPNSKFAVPPGARRRTIDALSGGLATENSPSTVEEWIPNGAEVGPDTWHVRENGRPVTLYPAEYTSWLRDSRRAGHAVGLSPQEDFSVLKPVNGATFFYDPSIPRDAQMLAIETTAGQDSGLHVFLDGVDRGPLADDGTFWLPLEKGHPTIIFKRDGEERGRVRLTVK